MIAIAHRRRATLFACTATLAVQVLFLALRPHDALASNLCIAFGVALAALECLLRSYETKAHARHLWRLLALAFAFSLAGQLDISYVQQKAPNFTQTTALKADFLFFAYGLPILLAICSDWQRTGELGLAWIDVLQSVIATGLVYVQLFSSLSSLYKVEPISATHLMYLYDAENCLLAVAVSLRLRANRSNETTAFYRVLAIYLWLYGGIALVLGYLELQLNVSGVMQDTLWTVPYVALIAASTSLPEKTGEASSGERLRLELVLSNLCPILFTVAIVFLGLSIAQQHLILALACSSVAVLLYGARAALLQSSYMLSEQKVISTTEELREANTRLLELSTKDALTDIPNRRHFDLVLQQEWTRATRTQWAISLLMVDVDFFKLLNDHYGHQEGDRCLRCVAVQMAAIVRRPADLVARYGGEEFALILPETDLQGAFTLAEEVRLAILSLRFPHATSAVGEYVTVSIGVSSSELVDVHCAEDLVQRADEALYRAKSAGRNQVWGGKASLGERLPASHGE